MNTLASLFAFKTWAHAELIETMNKMHAGTYPEEWRAAIRTLNHAYVSDRIFRAHLAGERHSYTATNTVETPTLEVLASSIKENDAWFEEYVSSITQEQLREVLRFTFTDGDSGQMSREEMLLHVITHNGYHRGNVGQILEAASVEAPRDLYTRFLHSSQPSRRQS